MAQMLVRVDKECNDLLKLLKEKLDSQRTGDLTTFYAEVNAIALGVAVKILNQWKED